MDLLDFGMENIESESAVKRAAAKIALMTEKKKAELFEMYLKQKPLDILENPLRDQQMLQRIMEQVEEYEKTQAAADDTN